MYSFSYLEPVCCSMSSSNCCFLTCILVSQEAGQVVWYSHIFKNFPQFVVIHTVKGFGIVNKAEVDVFLELSSFSVIQWMLTIWSLVPLPFLNPAWISGSSWFMYCWSLAWRIYYIIPASANILYAPKFNIFKTYYLFPLSYSGFNKLHSPNCLDIWIIGDSSLSLPNPPLFNSIW